MTFKADLGAIAQCRVDICGITDFCVTIDRVLGIYPVESEAALEADLALHSQLESNYLIVHRTCIYL